MEGSPSPPSPPPSVSCGPPWWGSAQWGMLQWRRRWGLSAGVAGRLRGLDGPETGSRDMWVDALLRVLEARPPPWLRLGGPLSRPYVRQKLDEDWGPGATGTLGATVCTFQRWGIVTCDEADLAEAPAIAFGRRHIAVVPVALGDRLLSRVARGLVAGCVFWLRGEGGRRALMIWLPTPTMQWVCWTTAVAAAEEPGWRPRGPLAQGLQWLTKQRWTVAGGWQVRWRPWAWWADM